MSIDTLIDSVIAGLEADVTDSDSTPIDEVGTGDTVEDVDIQTDTDADEADVEEPDDSDDSETDVEDVDSEDESTGDSVIDVDTLETVVVNGKEVKFSEAFVPKSEFTKRTQAIAEERKEWESLLSDANSQVEAATQLFGRVEEDPVGLAADILADTPADTTAKVVKLIYSLAAKNALEDQFLTELGINKQDPRIVAASTESEKRIAAIERQQRAMQEEYANQQRQVQEQEAQLAEYTQQLDNFVSASGLVFETPNERTAWETEVIKVASERGIFEDLSIAAELLALREKAEGVERKKASDVAKAKTVRKRNTRVVSKPSSSSPEVAPRIRTVDDALAATVARMESEGKL